MTFQNPEALWMIVAASAAFFLGYLLMLWRGMRVLKFFGGRKRLVERGSRIPRMRADLVRAVVITLVFFLFAAAYWLGPQIKETQSIPIYEGAEVCFAIDASRSSLARDIRFTGQDGNELIMSRFAFAKLIVKEAKELLSPDDTPCLIFFADVAINTVPIVKYADVAWEYINLDLRYADDYFVEHEIPQGSNFAAMILKTLGAFSEKPTRKILIVISDGEPESGLGADVSAENRRQAAFAKFQTEVARKIKKFRASYEFSVELLGVGDMSKTSPIPKKTSESGKVLKYHENPPGSGKIILTRPDPAFLLSAAQSLGGRYRHVTDPDDAKKKLATIFSREKKIIGWEAKEEIGDAWPYFVMAGLVLLFTVPFLKSP